MIHPANPHTLAGKIFFALQGHKMSAESYFLLLLPTVYPVFRFVLSGFARDIFSFCLSLLLI
jgi:hypothetical protein